MKKTFGLLFIFLGGFLPGHAQAESNHFMLAVGSEIRTEKDLENNRVTHALTNYAVGMAAQKYLVIFEKATFSESSGNQALNVQRQLENYMVWGQYRAHVSPYFIPYLGAGVGAYKEVVTTNLENASSRNSETPQKLVVGANFGLQANVRIIWLSIEGRVLFGDELDPQPSLGGLFRLGLWF